MEKVARPFRVCLTGAESTGKTDLARMLAARFGAPWVPEFARQYAERAGRELSYMDVMPISKGQMQLEGRIAEDAGGLLILDTDLVSTVCYARHHFGACPAMIEALARQRLADLYLLLDIDVPWMVDPVRDTGATREALHERFRDILDELGANVRTISGSNWDDRFRQAVEILKSAPCPVPGAQ